MASAMIISEWIERDLSRQYFIRINNAVGLTLFSQEALAILGKILIDSVASDERIETCATAVSFRTKDPSKSLSFFLT